MKQTLESFSNSYKKAFSYISNMGLNMTPDNVLIRWLEESSFLVVSLMESRLSMYLGVCLVTQFLDMLTYSEHLFSAYTIENDKDPQKIQFDIEESRKNFGEFFSNTAILVDSMNQTNRQFVQVPAFHLSSFNIPPQVLAFYVVLARRLRDVLQDDDNVFYGLTISPRLVNTLSVSSLALQNVRPSDQWIFMKMDESAFYTLRLTAETIAHEISHFVGQKNRNRGERKACIIQCAFIAVISGILGLVEEKLNQGLQDNKIKFSFNSEELHAMASAMKDQAIKVCGEKYNNEHNCYMDDVDKLLKQIPYDTDYYPEIHEQLFNGIWAYIEKDKERFGRILDRVSDVFYKHANIRYPALDEDKTLFFIVKNRLKRIFFDSTTEFYEQYKQFRESDTITVKPEFKIIEKLCYLFRETFADLQAILLFDMKWADYCMLLKRSPDRPLVKDCPPRMLAVTRVLQDNKKWDNDLSYGGKEFEVVKNAVNISPSKKPHTLAEEFKLEPSIIYYLEKYLGVCAKSIIGYLSEHKRRDQVKKLRDIHSCLSPDVPFIHMQQSISEYIDLYYQELKNMHS